MLLLIVGCSKNTLKPLPDLREAAKARTTLGLAYLERKDFVRALRNLDIAYHYSPENLQVNMALAHYYTLLSNYKQASLYYHSMLKSYPDDFNVLNNYAVFLCRFNQFESARQYFDKALTSQTASNITATYINSGLCAQKNNNTDRARAMFNQALTREPANQTAYQGIIDISIKEQQTYDSYHLLRKYQSVTHSPLPDRYLTYFENLKQKYD